MSESFDSQGYLVFADALSGDDLGMLRDVCDTLLEEPAQDGGAGLHNIGLGNARRFLRHRHADFPELDEFVTSEKIDRIVRPCLGSDSVLFNEQFVVKGAGERRELRLAPRLRLCRLRPQALPHRLDRA